MQIHLVSGFLGSGKTTGIRTACEVLMNEHKRVGVITNDQGIRLVDTGYFASVSIPNRQVVDGCFCCNYNALRSNIESLLETNQPEIIFAESVGSCTDIVATVMKPLQQYSDEMEITVSTFADALLLKMLYVDGKNLFRDEVNYIYQKQLEEAGMIVVTKNDLITDNEMSSVKAFLSAQYPDKTVVYIDGRKTESIAPWMKTLQQQSDGRNILSSLQIDYDTYGAGEAMLAWLDEEAQIYSSYRTAMEDALALTHVIYQKIQEKELAIGHLKFLIDDTYKVSYTATPEETVTFSFEPSPSSRLLINARIQTSQKALEQLIHAAIKETEEERKCRIVVQSSSSFEPGYPRPTHRIAD